MKMAVCMKCVPADFGVGVDAKGGIKRTEANSRVNQADLMALQAALRLKGELGARVDVYSMGPAFAENMLREAIALGADGAVLICDKHLAGSDTQVTAAVLAAALGSDYDLVLCGERTVDGETGQVPGQISARLNASLALGVVDIRSCENGVICLRPDERGEDELKLSFPAVAGVSCGLRGALQEMRPRLEGMKRARAANIPHLDAGALGFRWDEVGEAASPTKVRSVSRVNWARECVMAESLADGVDISLEMIYGW